LKLEETATRCHVLPRHLPLQGWGGTVAQGWFSGGTGRMALEALGESCSQWGQQGGTPGQQAAHLATAS